MDLLLTSLSSFISVVLKGDIRSEILPFFFGANLIALQKPGGGVRPIAVGCTLRRLVAKVAGLAVKQDMIDLLSPFQLGFGLPGGAEAAIHAARIYMTRLTSTNNTTVVKLDFQNAFNSIRRVKMLSAVSDLCPVLYPFIHSSYSAPSHLFWGSRRLVSADGVQQGDPLGPLLFCLTIHPLIIQLKVNLSYSIWMMALSGVILSHYIPIFRLSLKVGLN